MHTRPPGTTIYGHGRYLNYGKLLVSKPVKPAVRHALYSYTLQTIISSKVAGLPIIGNKQF